MRVAAYARTSVTDYSVDSQLQQLRRYAEREGWTIPAELEFVDAGETGAKVTRPGLNALRHAVAQDLVDVVLVTAPDRLARDLVGGLLLAREFRARGVRLVILSLGIDTATPAGELALAQMLAWSEFWLKDHRLRTERGRAAARARGVRFGRPPRNVTEATRDRILELRREGRSLRTIAAHTRTPKSTVVRILRRAETPLPRLAAKLVLPPDVAVPPTSGGPQSGSSGTEGR